MEFKEKVIGIIKSQINDINDKLAESKIKYADCCLNEEEWQVRTKYEKMCKIHEGQIVILEGLERTIENEIFGTALQATV